jgi:VIT1/CCC1 family predicted Fe2+/Mn2+ transporter
VPEEEEEELALIYQTKGLPADQAKALAQRLIANKETALDTLVREELGIDPDEVGGSAWAAAGTSFLLFAIGAIFPVARISCWRDRRQRLPASRPAGWRCS